MKARLPGVMMVVAGMLLIGGGTAAAHRGGGTEDNAQCRLVGGVGSGCEVVLCPDFCFLVTIGQPLGLCVCQ